MPTVPINPVLLQHRPALARFKGASSQLPDAGEKATAAEWPANALGGAKMLPIAKVGKRCLIGASADAVVLAAQARARSPTANAAPARPGAPATSWTLPYFFSRH
jgi:hypothetical protein